MEPQIQDPLYQVIFTFFLFHFEKPATHTKGHLFLLHLAQGLFYPKNQTLQNGFMIFVMVR